MIVYPKKDKVERNKNILYKQVWVFRGFFVCFCNVLKILSLKDGSLAPSFWLPL